MPQLFKVGSYLIYFWSNEGNPLEAVHVHISEGTMSPNSTKVWLTHNGKCILENNMSRIPEPVLRRIMNLLEARSNEIILAWRNFFGQARFII